MKRHRAPVRLAALMGVVAVLGAACSDPSSTAGSTTTTKPGATQSSTASTTKADTKANASSTGAVPEVGDCLEPMTPALANGFTLPQTVECSEPHGGEVLSIIDLPDTAKYPAMQSRPVGVDDAIADCMGSDEQAGAFAEFAGSNELQVTEATRTKTGVQRAWSVSGLQPAAYLPGPAAWAAGGRWMVCAAVLNNTIEEPSQYTGSAKGARLEAIEPQLAWCKQQDAETANFSAVPCTKPHNYEQLSNFPIAADDADYPGDEVVDGLGQQLCRTFDAAATDGRSDSLPPGFQLAWYGPSSTSWAQGDRIMRCYVFTEKGQSTGTIGSGSAKLVP